MRTLAVFAVLIAAARAAGPPVAADGIAVIDLRLVLKGAKAFKVFEAELKARMAEYQKRDEELRSKPKSEANDRLIEQNKMAGSKELAALQEKQLLELYRLAETASRKLAHERGFAVVAHFASKDPRPWASGASIERRLQAGALQPIWFNPANDITEALIAEIDAAFRKGR
ncbi:MAG: OmpH family outer membrane protein [Gemmataceae bacterium]|nr:OmpH family outer membrane protein [Gemmataceae bacterium]